MIVGLAARVPSINKVSATCDRWDFQSHGRANSYYGGYIRAVRHALSRPDLSGAWFKCYIERSPD